jgi:16S rRNA (uracil1498-N3)-methyltransferase
VSSPSTLSKSTTGESNKQTLELIAATDTSKPLKSADQSLLHRFHSVNETSAPRAAPRLYCEDALSPHADIKLSERAARHAQALRLQVGDALTLFDGSGDEWSATLSALSKRGSFATLQQHHHIERESSLPVHLLQGVCAGDRMDVVLQKATELGVTTIQPIATLRSVVRLPAERQQRRQAHWQNIAIAACEQCGRNIIPPVAPSISLAEYLSTAPHEGLRIMLNPMGEHRLAEIQRPAGVNLLIGPEGGLTPDEIDLATAHGFIGVRFGPRILRTETAPLAALAAMQCLWGDC